MLLSCCTSHKDSSMSHKDIQTSDSGSSCHSHHKRFCYGPHWHTEQDRQCICIITLWHILVSTIAAGTQQWILCALLSYTSLSIVQNYWVLYNALIENFVTSNNKMCVGLHVKCFILHWDKEFSQSLYTYNLAKLTVMTEKTCSGFSVSVSIAINHLTKQVELINFEAVSLKYCVYPCLSYPACKSNNFYTALHCNLRPVCTYVFPHI